MLQSLATMLFTAAAVFGAMLVASLIRNDWAAIRSALGWEGSFGRAPLAPEMRALPARRAAIVRVELAGLRRAA